MRRGICVLLAALFLALPASAQAVYDGGDRVGVLAVEQGTQDASLVVQNKTLFSVYVLGQAEEMGEGSVRLTVRQNGAVVPVFSGETGALSEGEVLLCTLRPLESVTLEAACGDATAFQLRLTAQRVSDAVLPDYVRLILWLGLWMALVLLGAYGTVVISCRKRGERRKKRRKVHAADVNDMSP